MKIVPRLFQWALFHHPQPEMSIWVPKQISPKPDFPDSRLEVTSPESLDIPYFRMQRSGFLFDLWVFSLRVLAYLPLNIHAAAKQFFTELSEMKRC